MALSEEGVLPVLALVLTVVSIVWSIYVEKRRQREREEDNGTRQRERQQDITSRQREW